MGKSNKSNHRKNGSKLPAIEEKGSEQPAHSESVKDADIEQAKFNKFLKSINCPPEIFWSITKVFLVWATIIGFSYLMFCFGMWTLIAIRNLCVNCFKTDIPSKFFLSSIPVSVILYFMGVFMKEPDEGASIVKKKLTRFLNKKLKIQQHKRLAAYILLLMCCIGFSYVTPSINKYYSKQVDYIFTHHEEPDKEKKDDDENTSDTEKEEQGSVWEDPEYNGKMSFVLNDLTYRITKDMKNKVYFAVTGEEFQAYVNGLFEQEKTAITNRHFDSYTQTRENEFYQMRDTAKSYAEINGRVKEWYELLPSENMLLDTIDIQEEYAEGTGSFFMYNRISNNYQLLALEYLAQDGDINTVKYYYFKSIENDMLSIAYALSDNDFNEAKQRLLYRYKDILKCCDVDSQEKDILELYISELNNMFYR